jgi:hypothetical protein
VDAALASGEPYAALDGEDLKMKRIATGPFTLILPDPNIFGLPAGPYEHLAVSDGLWVYLPQGLKPGEYTVEFGGDFGDVTSLNITYELRADLAIKCATHSGSTVGRKIRSPAYPRPTPMGFHAFHKPEFPPSQIRLCVAGFMTRFA